MKKTPIYENFLNTRNERIRELRRCGKRLKYLAKRFGLSVRQINRILRVK